MSNQIQKYINKIKHKWINFKENGFLDQEMKIKICTKVIDFLDQAEDRWKKARHDNQLRTKHSFYIIMLWLISYILYKIFRNLF